MGMRQLNGQFAQYFNRRHGLVGHVFQGRYKAILVQREAYLLELARYIALNPVRAGLAQVPEAWRWSSHRLLLENGSVPDWLDQECLLERFSADGAQALTMYRQFVLAGLGAGNPLVRTCHQLVLGDDNFVARHKSLAEPGALRAVAKPQRRLAAMSLAEYAARYPDRQSAMAAAYRSTAFTMSEIAAHFNVSARTVNRAVKFAEQPGTD